MKPETPGADVLLAQLGALASPHRMRIIAELERGRAYVSELARMIGLSRPLTQMHLAKLEAAGLVSCRLELSGDGKAVKYYEVSPFALALTPQMISEAAAQLDPRRDGKKKE